jgi:hypothetical protein
MTLETALNTFAIAFITGAAIATVSAVISLVRRMRDVDRTTSALTKWAKRVGRQLHIPFPPNGDEDE